MTNEQTTGDDGKATFQLPYGDYTATITKDGYQTKTEDIAFRSNYKNFSISLESVSSTGTVTVTCKDGSENLLGNAVVFLLTENAAPSPTNVVGTGITGEDGVTLLYEFDEQGQPTSVVKEVEYGDYYLIATNASETLSYSGALTVDGDEEVTVTLTAE